MGRVFTLLIITFALLSAAANAFEFGTPKDRAAVRYDVERLLARTIAEQNKTPQDLNITDVVTDGDWALAVYTIGNYRGFMTLHKIWAQWWDMADGSFDARSCVVNRATPPLKANTSTVYAGGASAACLEGAGLPSVLAVQASNIAAVGQTNGAQRPRCDICGAQLHPGGGTVSDPCACFTGGYLTTLNYDKIVNPAGAQVSRFYGRAPTENESTQHPNGDAFYFFTLELSGSKPVTFVQGATLDVWFPHVLMPNLRYRITAGFSTKSFGPIRGTLSNNTLHYVLPEFTLAPQESMMFEIDGDP